MQKSTVKELRKIAKEKNITPILKRKADLVAAIKKVEEVDSEFPDYATILKVSPTTILIERTCSLCAWKLSNSVLEILRSESDVDADIPSRYSLASGSYELDKQPSILRYEKI